MTTEYETETIRQLMVNRNNLVDEMRKKMIAQTLSIPESLELQNKMGEIEDRLYALGVTI